MTGVDRRELRDEILTNGVHRRDDRDRDAGGNQAVFDGRRAGFIAEKTRYQILHGSLHLQVTP